MGLSTKWPKVCAYPTKYVRIPIRGSSPKCWHKMSLYAVVYKCCFTGTKGTKPVPTWHCLCAQNQLQNKIVWQSWCVRIWLAHTESWSQPQFTLLRTLHYSTWPHLKVCTHSQNLVLNTFQVLCECMQPVLVYSYLQYLSLILFYNLNFTSSILLYKIYAGFYMTEKFFFNSIEVHSL